MNLERTSASSDPFPDADSARGLVADVASLPLAHDLVVACTVRTRGIISYLLAQKVPRDALCVVGNFVPDLSARGLDTHYSHGAVMHRRSAFAPHTLSQRVAYDGDMERQPDWKSRGVARVDDISIYHQIWNGRPGVSIGTVDGEKRWWVAEPTRTQPFASHYAPAVWVSGPERGPALMVIDTAQSKHEPQTIEQWRAKQGYPDAVTALADVGGPFRIHADTLSLDQATRLARSLGLTDRPTAPALDARWGQLSDKQRATALTSFFRWTAEPPGKDIPETLVGYSEALRQVVTSSSPLFPPEQDIGAMFDHAVTTFVPLHTYQTWLQRTDAALGQRLHPQRPPVLHSVASPPPPELAAPSKRAPDAETTTALLTIAAAGLTPVVESGMPYPLEDDPVTQSPILGPLAEPSSDPLSVGPSMME
ncbi:hypothetical protein [Streptodolium elevatio]|uniref:Uncharacterized protein n=1 Tax=Streptodolium elevatio TaxID=3157996 RepID=A0ABV3DUW0_9ACTN